MTLAKPTTMPGIAFDGRTFESSTRPAIMSHQSSSLPNTPFPPMRDLSSESKPPSPNVPSSNPSPVLSDSNKSLPSLRRRSPTAGCKFETGMAFSKRRMAYSMGTDLLEKAIVTPQESLSSKDERRLTHDIRELYNKLIPTPESVERRAQFIHKLESLLNKQWPDSYIKVNVFGSSGNLLCTNDSDVDVCVTTPTTKLNDTCALASVLAEHGMEQVVCVPHAKVPIVKMWDPELRLACDLNVNNTLALENTRMIRTYVEIDERVRPIAMILKYWAKRRIINDAALGGTLSSYTWTCLIINYLQTRKLPVLPALHQRPHQRLTLPDGSISPFADDIETLRGFGKGNKETLGQLLFGFFRYYAYEFDYERHVISIRHGSPLTKEEKGWHLMQNNRLCVEEPFNTIRNLANTADDTSFRGIHLEVRRAFDLIAEGKLEECCEQYVYPAEEERIWAKPPPQPRPVLSRSISQSKKDVNGATANTRHVPQPNRQHHISSSSRPAFAVPLSHNHNQLRNGFVGVSTQVHGFPVQFPQNNHHNQLDQLPQNVPVGVINQVNGFPAHVPQNNLHDQLLQNVPVGVQNQVPGLSPQFAQNNLHDQFPQNGPVDVRHQVHGFPPHYSQNNLHDQLFRHYQILQAQEQHLRLQLHQQNQVAHVMGHGPWQSHILQNQYGITNVQAGVRPGYNEPLPLSAPLRPGMYAYPLHYGPMPFVTHTNPNSPSFLPARLDTRRSLHRTSPIDGGAGGPLRSQSQPAPTMPSMGAPCGYYGPQGVLPYHHSPPPQYAGYWLGGPPGGDHHHYSPAPSPYPAYSDLACGTWGVPHARGTPSPPLQDAAGVAYDPPTPVETGVGGSVGGSSSASEGRSYDTSPTSPDDLPLPILLPSAPPQAPPQLVTTAAPLVPPAAKAKPQAKRAANGWQQGGKKGGRKKAKPTKVGAVRGRGEPFPAEESQRKGG